MRTAYYHVVSPLGIIEQILTEGVLSTRPEAIPFLGNGPLYFGDDMRSCLPALVLCMSLLVPATVLAQKDDDIKFPSDSEVKLIVTQARRAMEQYEVAVQLEDQLLGSKPNGKEAVNKDKEVLDGLKTLIDGLDQHPDKFNSLLGFYLVTTLDDASRNAHVCAASAVTFASFSETDKSYSTSHALLTLAQSCTDTGVLLYTVSESATPLYVRYIENMDKLAESATKVLIECQEALKKADAKKN